MWDWVWFLLCGMKTGLVWSIVIVEWWISGRRFCWYSGDVWVLMFEGQFGVGVVSVRGVFFDGMEPKVSVL